MFSAVQYVPTTYGTSSTTGSTVVVLPSGFGWVAPPARAVPAKRAAAAARDRRPAERADGRDERSGQAVAHGLLCLHGSEEVGARGVRVRVAGARKGE